MTSRKIAAALAVGVLLSLSVASPASAATLPSGDSLYAITCEDGYPGTSSALYSVNPADASGTQIGATTGPGDCATQGAYDPTTGNSYYVSWGPADASLVRIDVTTGARVVVATYPGLTGPYPDSMAIGLDGVGYFFNSTQLFRVDLQTGTVTLVSVTAINNVFAFSVDPSTGLFYAVDIDGEAFSVDVATGASTPIGFVVTGADVYSLQIDTSGAWWVEQDGPRPGLSSEIWTGARPDAGSSPPYTLVGTFSNATTPYTEALLITYPARIPIPAGPQLANSGADASSAPLIAGAAALALTAGFALVLLRPGARPRQRSNRSR